MRFQSVIGVTILAAVLATPSAESRVESGAESGAGAVDEPFGLLADHPTLPDGVAPLDPAFEDEMTSLIESAVEYRGLSLLEALAVGTQDVESARRTITGLLAEELPPDSADAAQRALTVLGLWPADLDLTEVLIEVLVSEVAGYYDPERDYLAVVENESVLSDLASDAGEGDLMARMADAIWVHEIGHALQDQHFDLEAIGADEELLSDTAMARDALVEGDATLLMFSFLIETDAAGLSEVEGLLGGILDDPEQAAMMLGGDSVLERAPPYLRQSLVFPYFGGLSFCLEVSRFGGRALLDHAFRHDRPRSTEQILHPEKWLGPRDEPIEIDLGDLDPWLGARQRLLGGTLGEMTLRVLFEEGLARADDGNDAEDRSSRAREAAAGWGGDAVALYGDALFGDASTENVSAGNGSAGNVSAGGARTGDDVLVWVSEWETLADADEVAAILDEVLGPGWTWRQRGSRIASVNGLRGGRARRVLKRLMVAPATRRPAVPIDLAALGIEPADATPRPDLERLVEDPVDDVETLDLARRLTDELTGSGDEGLAGVDLDELLESPEMTEMAARLLSQASNPEIAVSGTRVSIPGLGFAADLPASGEWTVRTTLEGADPEALAPAFEADEASTGAFVSITAVTLPMALPLETVAMGVRAAPVLEDAEELRGGYSGTGRGRAFERVIRGRQMGQNLRLLQRLYVIDGTLVVILAGGADADWPKVEPLTAAIMNSIEVEESPKEPSNW